MKGLIPFIYSSVCALSMVISSYAQVDSLVLSEANVLENSPLRSLEKTSYTTIESVLSKNPSINIKDSGPSAITSISMRGGGTSHVSVRWNGVEINSPLLGQLNVGLINPVLFDEIELGVSAQDKANTGLSGDLNFKNSNELVKGFKHTIFLETHTYDHKKLNTHFRFGKGRTVTGIKIYEAFGKNNYPIAIKEGEIKFQEHADIERKGIMADHVFYINKKNKIDARAWIQDSYSLLPPHAAQNKSLATQYDKFKRFQANYERQLGKNNLNLQLSYFDETSLYINQKDSSRNSFDQFQANLLWTKSFQNGWRGAVRSSLTRIEGETDHFDSVPLRITSEINASIDKTWKKFQLNMMGAGLKINESYLPSFKLFGKYFLTKNFHVKGTYHKNFRIPSFNDLYWNRGGNPDLSVEKSESLEVGVRYKFEYKWILLEPTATLYNRETINWIMWILDPQEDIWKANNLAPVHSKGLEYSLPMSFKISPKWNFNIGVGGQFSSSEFSEPVELPNINKGDQMYYFPKVSYVVKSSISYSGYSFSADLEHRGINHGVLYELEPYQVMDIAFSKIWDVKKESIGLFLIAHNVFNTWYEMVERRPLPARYFSIAIKFKSL